MNRMLLQSLSLTLLLVLAVGIGASACTSFMLETDKGLYFAHSLNQGNTKSVPGSVFINQRDKWKHGYSWEALININDDPAPALVWKSQFGSVTFNTFGREFPDGGMNEKGLFIWEMGFDTEYPNDENKPKLFQCQWMQYVLDNFATTEEVIENAHRMAIDGWGWHYFVADRLGNTAIIDFVGGKPVVYSGDNMPVDLCCNSVYTEAVTWLKQHKGFGGELEIEKIHEEIPRFVYGAKLINEFDTQNPVDYSFYTLDEMSNNVRWAIVFDVANSKAYFKTNLNQDIRHFAFTPDDFGRAEGALMLDIECPGPGNVRDKFENYNQETERQQMKNIFAMMCDMADMFKKVLLEDNNTDLDGLSAEYVKRIESMDKSANSGIPGTWVGTVKYPASGELMELPMTLVLDEENGKLSGSVDDGELVKNVPITNIECKGGLLYFTIRHPDSRDILHYQLYMTANEIKGAISFINGAKKGTVSLKR